MDMATIVLYAIGIGLVTLSCGTGAIRGVSAARETDPVPVDWAICEAMFHTIACVVLLIPISPDVVVPSWQMPLAWTSPFIALVCAGFAFAAAGKPGNARMGKLAVVAHLTRLPIAVIPLLGMSIAPMT